MSAGRTVTLLFRLVEGAGIALDSLRSNKVRAALTVLGVAIGVMVVIAMGSAITGINRSITGILESAGPKTFVVVRYWSGGLEISDGSDELSPWRRMPEITVDEAELLRQLPAAVAPWSVVVGMVLGIGVGVVAGVYPASRASRLDPIVALRAE